ncbi:RraA family protein [Bradyrhizobium canariense]|uniref:RraA family protein n=1 Tax=Bradyrhizobium canariense TaxID=255045 RepID=UPI001CA4C31D|nr:RraA family protein [Bradyrhizobium canariense]MBW5440233.1 RraA family protein [Bradyrhizobium canariense]
MQTSGLTKNASAPQVSADIITALRDIPVALLSDNMQRNRGSVGLTPYHKPASLAGTAVTVLTRGGDNLAILRAFEFCRPGDVMVIDAGGDTTNAVIGGILSFYGATIGLAGMVIDGAIRDVAEIRERTFPIYARGVNHRGPYKDGPGAINVPVTVGGMVVRPGDLLVGDQDGLLAFAPDAARSLIANAETQRAREEATMQAMRDGRWDRSFIDALEARCAN